MKIPLNNNIFNFCFPLKVIGFSVFLILLMALEATSQTAPGKYWVRFADKDNSPFSINTPSAFLSEECINRRALFGIGFNWQDIPVKQEYIDQVLALGTCTLANKSKWFNAITIYTDDSLLIAQIALLPFVIETKSVHSIVQGDKLRFATNNSVEIKSIKSSECISGKTYGPSFSQIEMLNGHLLHELGFTGKGIRIAVLDAGWSMTDKLPAFDKMRANGQLKGRRDFVSGGNYVYDYSHHGTFVLSLMAGYIPDSLCGTAPDAEYWLFRTEDAFSEYLVEEDNWVAAAEVCDSLGIDIINSSLGYSLFDDSLQNHTYADMDGNTTHISIAADIAASKGILVVNSAGNSGDDPWKFITAPSDGDSVLCIGAVDASEIHASFSSYGPSSDGDVKPNVCAMGYASVIADLDSTIRTGNGTSFSSPITAGMAACLWQAHPLRNNMEIFRAIEQSADLYSSPNDSLGYGIPDFFQAFLSLRESDLEFGSINAEIFPNPFSDYLNVVVRYGDLCSLKVTLTDMSGRIVSESDGMTGGNGIGILHLNTKNALAHGMYLLKITSEQGTVQTKVTKR